MREFDRIVKDIVLRAPVERVWHAITDIAEFAQWFGAKLGQPFAPGQTITGTFEGGFDEAYVKQCQVSFGLEPTAIRLPEPNTVFCPVERMEAPSLFSFRWIPYGIDVECDPAGESLVEFRLKTIAEGTRLTITVRMIDSAAGFILSLRIPRRKRMPNPCRDSSGRDANGDPNRRVATNVTERSADYHA